VVPSQLVPVGSATRQLQDSARTARLLDGDGAGAAAYELAFSAQLPPLGYAAFAVVVRGANSSSSSGSGGGSESHPAAEQTLQQYQSAAAQRGSRSGAGAMRDPQRVVVANGVLNLTFDAVSGRMLGVSAADGSWHVPATQELVWYNSSRGDEPADPPPAAAPAPAAAAPAAAAAGARGVRAARNGGQASGAYIFRPAGSSPVS
jgi:hypothetical protein